MWGNNRKQQLQAEAERDEARQALAEAQQALVDLEEKYQYVLMLWGTTLNTSNELSDRFDELRAMHRQCLECSGRMHDN